MVVQSGISHGIISIAVFVVVPKALGLCLLSSALTRWTCLSSTNVEAEQLCESIVWAVRVTI